MLKRQGNLAIAIDEELNTIIDKTTNASYVYVSENLRPAAVSTDADRRCYRITVASGSVSWADSVATFTKQASAAATYTYPN